jgi:hypothetical protein
VGGGALSVARAPPAAPFPPHPLPAAATYPAGTQALVAGAWGPALAATSPALPPLPAVAAAPSAGARVLGAWGAGTDAAGGGGTLTAASAASALAAVAGEVPAGVGQWDLPPPIPPPLSNKIKHVQGAESMFPKSSDIELQLVN